MAGKFITFEGGDGAGKTTQIRRLAARLSSAGERVAMTREPGGTPAAEAIRSIILSGRAAALGHEAEAFLFAAARADHVERFIRPRLAAGEWVLCDRFSDSTRVYQGTLGGVDGRLLDLLDRAAIGDARPALTLVLDVPAEIGLGRVATRLRTVGGEPDRFEKDAVPAYEQRRQGYLAIAADNPGRCVVIDGGAPEETVAEAIWQTVSSRFLKKVA